MPRGSYAAKIPNHIRQRRRFAENCETQQLGEHAVLVGEPCIIVSNFAFADVYAAVVRPEEGVSIRFSSL